MTDVPLKLTTTGRGSRASIVALVTEVLADVHKDVTVETLADALVTGVLHRLGAELSAARGLAPRKPLVREVVERDMYAVIGPGVSFLAIDGGTDPARAHEFARSYGCMVVKLPVVGDYFSGETRAAGSD